MLDENNTDTSEAESPTRGYDVAIGSSHTSGEDRVIAALCTFSLAEP